MADKLKPYPFCGSTNVGDMKGWVQCFNCNASGPDSYDKKKSVEAWNRRAEDNNDSKN